MIRLYESRSPEFSSSLSRTPQPQLRWFRKLAFTAGSYCGLESHQSDFRKGALVVEERKVPSRLSVPFKFEAKQDGK